MKKTIFFLILSMLISFSVNAQFCNKYADKAVSQYKLAKKNNLPNINWPVWSDDWNGHLNWCKSVSHDVANKEQAKRQAYLDKYIKPQSKEDFCNTYADEAVKQYNKAKQLFNPQGPEWSSNRDEHYQWCMQVPENVAKGRQAIRQAHIDEYIDAQMHSQPSPDTKTKGTVTVQVSDVFEPQDLGNLISFKEKTCKYYAEESVKQNKQNISQGCGFNSNSWSSNDKGHYDWCMHGNNYLQVDKAIKGRKKLLTRCPGENIIRLQGMVIGLRNSSTVDEDPFIPATAYYNKLGIDLTVKYYIIDDDDASDALPPTFEFRMIKKGPFNDPLKYKLPEGIVIGLGYRDKQKSGVIDKQSDIKVFGLSASKGGPEFLPGGTFRKYCGGDLGAGAGDGWCWYESTGIGFNDWSDINKLPRGTVVCLKHSSNQPNKKLVWKGHTYDPANPNIVPPKGFARKVGGDMGAPAGEGYFWYEKITGK